MWVKILTWLLAILFAVISGLPKLFGVAAVVQGFHEMGYSDGFRLLIGALEVGGGLALLVPAVRLYGALVLLVIMVGAVWTLLKVGQSPLPPIVVGALLGVLIAKSPRPA